ncbi:hypothetical protein Dda_4342 [Drechslerella dactyloides]|uniref:Uncharacterized protein n=1 Tax=Drechslerella dactyloides TaxID=74499 RepID=A0AAD6IX51_DREDA|nr:hypothetical protein Dda_4342 [Drechslerella dactyloides]
MSDRSLSKRQVSKRVQPRDRVTCREFLLLAFWAPTDEQPSQWAPGRNTALFPPAMGMDGMGAEMRGTPLHSGIWRTANVDNRIVCVRTRGVETTPCNR